MEASPLLKVSKLYKNFGGVQAIQDLNFELAEGELLGLKWTDLDWNKGTKSDYRLCETFGR